MNIHTTSPYSNNHVEQTFVLPYPFRAPFSSPLNSSHAEPQQGQRMFLWMHFCGGNSEGPPGGRPAMPTAPINTLLHGFNPAQPYCATPSQRFLSQVLAPKSLLRGVRGEPYHTHTYLRFTLPAPRTQGGAMIWGAPALPPHSFLLSLSALLLLLLRNLVQSPSLFPASHILT